MSDRSAGGLPAVTLVLGGARSGKSRHAEALVMHAAHAATYIATAEPGDAEMAARIAAHRAQRERTEHRGFWHTVEAPLDLATAIREHASPARPILVDCLTLWLSNLVLGKIDIDAETGHLERALAAAAAPVVLVANEVGSGIVPDNALGRRFRDAQGILNQRIAALADRVVLVVAGLPMALKGTL